MAIGCCKRGGAAAAQRERYNPRAELRRLVPELTASQIQGEKVVLLDVSVIASDVHEFTQLLRCATRLVGVAAMDALQAAPGSITGATCWTDRMHPDGQASSSSATACWIPYSRTASESSRSARARESWSLADHQSEHAQIFTRADCGSSGARRAAMSSITTSTPRCTRA
jgi:hypothetical protein